MCVDLHKSGNGYKKIATRLNLPVSTVRGIIKKFKTTGTVTNKAGRGPKFILPQRTVRRMVREVKKSSLSQNCIKEWHLGVTKSPKQPSDALYMPTSCLGGMQGKSLFSLTLTNVNVWSLLSGTGTSTGIVCFGQMRLRLSFLATNTRSGSGVKQKMSLPKSSSCPP